MKKLTVFSMLLCVSFSVCAQRVTNQFFALHNIIRDDSVYATYDKQVELVKNAGFDGIEINGTDKFEGMKAALEKHSFPSSYFYVKISLDAPFTDPKLKEYIAQLKGSRTIVAPFIVSDSKKYKPSSSDADTLVVRLVRQLAGWSKESGLQVAIYPHIYFYVERTDHALRLVRQINRKNVGLSFNLCHWLATTNETERKELRSHLKALKPHVKMITICGANDVISVQKDIWDDYILPLGQGTFDTYGLVQYMVKDLKYKNPIGVQCYHIKGDKVKLVHNTIRVWREYKTQLEE